MDEPLTAREGQRMRQLIDDEIAGYVREYEAETAWGEPLVAVAAADDPLFARLKEVVGATHALSRDLLPGALSVIAYYLPFPRTVVASNRRGYYASREWAVAYIETNRLIIELGAHLEEFLAARGYGCAGLPPTHNFDKQRLVSDWSHRHVAYIAGLGSFGLHRLLITARGCCGRIGSLITSVPLEPTPRPQREACLYRHDGSCRACIEHCVTGALQVDSFDRHKCYQLLLDNQQRYESEGVADVCGKCIVGMPCSFVDPVARRGDG